ncbi:MAG: GerMN domain-containing protein [Sedimentisphaerales bacterium]|nr:GerMN domain-containing protein [Sedimentisphaerales bacterium]
MNSESNAIVAIILILIFGFLAFVFFSNDNESANVTSGENFPGEPAPSAINISDMQTGEVAPKYIEIQPEPTKQNAVKSPLANRSIEDLIIVTSPLPYQKIPSPYIIEGKARGFWFFEADFPVMLANSDGKIIASGNAKAKSNWMTEDFVQFIATLEFSSGYERSGVVILCNNNPSGLVENNREVRIPIFFDMIEIQVFFGNHKLDTDPLLDEVYATTRVIQKTQATARAALEELLKGPTEQEKEAGFYTRINTGVRVQKLSIINGVARVDFSSQLEFQVAGSSRIASIYEQIEQTLKQFSTVREVIITIDGRTEDILQP